MRVINEGLTTSDMRQQPSRQPHPAATIHDSPEVQANAGKGPSNSNEVLDSERHEEVSSHNEEKENTNNVPLKQEIPRPITTLDHAVETGISEH